MFTSLEYLGKVSVCLFHKLATTKKVRRMFSEESALSQAISSMHVGYVDRRDNCNIILCSEERKV